jgi:hypothetical protein
MDFRIEVFPAPLLPIKTTKLEAGKFISNSWKEQKFLRCNSSIRILNKIYRRILTAGIPTPERGNNVKQLKLFYS